MKRSTNTHINDDYHPYRSRRKPMFDIDSWNMYNRITQSSMRKRTRLKLIIANRIGFLIIKNKCWSTIKNKKKSNFRKLFIRSYFHTSFKDTYSHWFNRTQYYIVIISVNTCVLLNIICIHQSLNRYHIYLHFLRA